MRGPLLVALVAVLPYLPSLGGGFLAYDDPYLVRTSRPIHAADLGRILDPRGDRASLGAEYLPVRDLTYVLDVRLGARTATGAPAPEAAWVFRVQSLLWYALGCGLAAALLLRLLGPERRRVALLAALAFALHPAHAESVAWIAGRKDVVSGALVYLALLVHLRAREDDALGAHAAVAGLAGLACLAKSTATCLPLLVACVELLDPAPGAGAPARRRLARVVPSLLACGAIAALAVAVGQRSGVGRPLDPLGLPARLLLWDPPILRRYVVTAAAPLRLRVHHHGLTALVLEPGGRRLLHAAVALLTLAPLLWVTLRAGARVRFAALWFVAALVPVANLLPFSQLVADRFLFLPLLGACLLLALGLARVERRAPRLAAVLALALLLGWGGLTAARAPDFGDDRRLWSANLRWEPGDPTALKHRGAARATAGDLAGAEADLTQALERFARARVTHPAHALEARLELANVHLLQAEPRRALAEVRRLDPSVLRGPDREAWVLRRRGALLIAGARLLSGAPTVDDLVAAVGAFREAGRDDLAREALKRLRLRDPLRAATLER